MMVRLVLGTRTIGPPLQSYIMMMDTLVMLLNVWIDIQTYSEFNVPDAMFVSPMLVIEIHAMQRDVNTQAVQLTRQLSL